VADAVPGQSPDLREQVRRRSAEAAAEVTKGRVSPGCGPACCGGQEDPQVFGAQQYSQAELAELPEAAALASLGCGNPITVAELQLGETVLDLGSGGGIDVILSARRVGPAGRAYGLDMTDEMLELSRRNARQAGISNAEFIKGTIESVPLPDASVDVVLSNCVINLSPDKGAVLREAFRVLRLGGRLAVSDVVAEDRLPAAQRAERGSYVGCIAGALSLSEYELGLREAGFAGISVQFSHEVADGIHGAIVRASKPELDQRPKVGRLD
jgi:SAM-dependent methyltransferase